MPGSRREGFLRVRPSALTGALVHGALLAIWLGAFLASALLEYAPHASLWFPPAAITFSALLVLGWRALPVLWLACLLSALITDRLYAQALTPAGIALSGLVFALTHTGAYGSVALILRRLAWDASPLTTLRKVTVVLIGGAVASGLAALLGAWGLSLTGMIAVQEVPGLLAPWWIGDYAGLLTLGALATVGLVRLAGAAGLAVPEGIQYFSRHHRGPGLTASSGLKLLTLLGSSALVLLGAALFPEKETLLFLLFVAIVVQLWIVHTETELCALIGIALFSLLLVIATTALDLDAQALMLQFVLISLAANSYLGLAVPSLYNDNERLRLLLTHDVLTGALSRAFFEERARDGVESARRRGESAVLVMIDLDNLKKINDHSGHAAGDTALRTLAQTCQRHLQPGQILGRLSGDEFAIFLPRATAIRAQARIDAIRHELAHASHPISASFGIAELAAGEESYETLLGRADRAMYREKR